MEACCYLVIQSEWEPAAPWSSYQNGSLLLPGHPIRMETFCYLVILSEWKPSVTWSSYQNGSLLLPGSPIRMGPAATWFSYQNGSLLLPGHPIRMEACCYLVIQSEWKPAISNGELASVF
jgi:hypothetical protein